MNCRVLESGVMIETQPYHINGDKGYNYDHWGVDLVDYSQGYHALGWIVAHSEGTVVECRSDCTGFEYNSYGNYVLIAHPNGMYTRYAHLSYGTVQVHLGEYVVRGQRLGYMGNTGTSYGGHLHFEVIRNDGYKIDPEQYLNGDLPGMGRWVSKQVWYLYDNGKMLTGWQKDNDKWYYMDKDTGIMQTYWHFDTDYNGWFYLGSDGAMEEGWKEIEGKWYYLSQVHQGEFSVGEMWRGWLSYGGKQYYLDPKSGVMYTGTHEIGGKTYTFDSSGALIA